MPKREWKMIRATPSARKNGQILLELDDLWLVISEKDAEQIIASLHDAIESAKRLGAVAAQ